MWLKTTAVNWELIQTCFWRFHKEGRGVQKQPLPINFNRSFIRGANEPCCTSRIYLLNEFSILFCLQRKFMSCSWSSTFLLLNYHTALCSRICPAVRLCVSAGRTVDDCSNSKHKKRKTKPPFLRSCSHDMHLDISVLLHELHLSVEQHVTE